MEVLLTPSNIMFAIGIISLLFTIWQKVQGPQVKADKTDALIEQRLKFQKESYDEKFKDMGVRLDQAFTLAQNHIHTVDTKVDTLDCSIRDMGLKIEKLSTIIEERIPKK